MVWCGRGPKKINKWKNVTANIASQATLKTSAPWTAAHTTKPLNDIEN